jgi:hypothetical protein
MGTATLPVVHRRSAIEAFACPRRYKALYIDGVPDESDPARRGSAFHAAAQRYIQALQQRKLTSDLELAQLALTMGLAETITPPHLAHEVTDLFWRWAESFELDLDALLLVEEKQRDDQGHSWTPDLVYAFDDVLEIRDWKTHFAIFSDARAAAEFQAKWYCWQARKLWPGFSRYRIVFVFVRYGIDVSAEFDVPELEYFETSVQGIVAAIRHAGDTNVFPAIPGASCSVCSLTCDVAEHPERVPLRLISRASAERALGVKLAMTAALRNIDAALQAYCTEHGAVTCNGMEVAHRPASKQEFPADGVYQVLHDAGIPPRFTVSKSALRSYLTTKKFSHVRAPLEALAKVTPANRFSVKRVGHDDAESEE